MTSTAALFTVAEVAQRLHISRRTLRRLIADGAIPVVQLTERAVRISADALDQYVRDHTVTKGKTAKDYRRAEAWN